jgi:hypothetical protein
VEIVSNVLVQLASEKGDLSDLQPLWRFIENKIDSVRRMRNSLAHGVLQTLVIRGKSHVRFSPLAFDVIRLGRPIDKGNIPGLTASDIMQSAMSAERLCRSGRQNEQSFQRALLRRAHIASEI